MKIAILRCYCLIQYPRHLTPMSSQITNLRGSVKWLHWWVFWKLNDQFWRLPIKYCTGTNQDFLLPNLRWIAFNQNIDLMWPWRLIRIKIQWTCLFFCISIFITTLPRRASRQGAPRGASWRTGRRRRRRLPALCMRQTCWNIPIPVVLACRHEIFQTKHTSAVFEIKFLLYRERTKTRHRKIVQ